VNAPKARTGGAGLGDGRGSPVSVLDAVLKHEGVGVQVREVDRHLEPHGGLAGSALLMEGGGYSLGEVVDLGVVVSAVVAPVVGEVAGGVE
jgi:hypothetical protein